MEPELAVALPAAGAACATALRPRPNLALVIGALLGLGGVAAVVLSTPGLSSDLIGTSLSFSAQSRTLLIVSAASLGLLVVFTPEAAERSKLLRWGLAALAGMTALAATASLDAALLVLVALVVMQSVAHGRLPLARRLRAPALAVAMLGIGLVLARIGGPPLLGRLGAVGLGAGLLAAIGALPFMHELDPEEEFPIGPFPWTAFVGPLLAVVVVERAAGLLTSATPGFAAMLIGLGLLNVVWGCLAAWRTANDTDAWRYSFTADWGLALCGFGLAVIDAQQAALLVLVTMLLSRLPLYYWSRQKSPEATPDFRPLNMLVAASFAGAAPFMGFAARVLLLRGATAMYWPLALAIALSLLLWLPSSLRLSRTLGAPSGMRLVGIVVVIGIGVAIGIYPQPLLQLATP